MASRWTSCWPSCWLCVSRNWLDLVSSWSMFVQNWSCLSRMCLDLVSFVKNPISFCFVRQEGVLLCLSWRTCVHCLSIPCLSGSSCRPQALVAGFGNVGGLRNPNKKYVHGYRKKHACGKLWTPQWALLYKRIHLQQALKTSPRLKIKWH